jgi:hypothetical protein
MNLPIDFQPVLDRPGWHTTAAAHWEAQECRELQLHESFPLPLQIVCGYIDGDSAHCIYAIENTSAVELAREFETGSHNPPFFRSQVTQVVVQLSRVFELAPFRPYFIDPAGYKAKFINPITARLANAIEDILTVGLESYASEYSGDGPLMADTLISENGLRLWWD